MSERTEIIPIEPDTANTGEGKCFEAFRHSPAHMKIQVNNQEIQISEQTFLAKVLREEMKLPSFDGIAVSVNLEIIAKSLWENFSLKEGDTILVIQATAGG